MGKASSAKKVARAARAGGNRGAGQRRALGFPALVAAIVVLGVSLVLFSRESREANAAPIPQSSDQINYDHWHAAYGIYDCAATTDNGFVFDGTAEGGPFFIDAAGDPLGIHTHTDGVIHIHPFLSSSGGRNARMLLFFQDVGITATNSTITFPDGTSWDEATKTCTVDGEEVPGEIVVGRWNSAQDASDGEAPSEIITEDFGGIRFRQDREYYTIAFLPEGQLENFPVRPGILDTLNNLTDVIDPNVTTTTAGDGEPDAATTTTGGEPDATTTTGPADDAATTTTAG